MFMAELIPDESWQFPAFVIKSVMAFTGINLVKAKNQYVIDTYMGKEIMADCQTYTDKNGRLFTPLFHLKTKIREEYEYATENI